MQRAAAARPGLAVSLRQLKGRLPFPALLYMLAVVLPVTFRLGPLQMTGVRLLLIVLIVPMMIRLLMGRYGRLLLVDILFVLHLGWATLALWVNNPEQVVANAGSTGIEFLGGYVMGRAYIRDRSQFLGLIRFLGFFVCATLPFALYETMTARPILLDWLNRLPGMNSLPDVVTDSRLGLNRVQLVFVHPIHYGLFCTLVFSLLFVGLKGQVNDGRRWMISAVAFGCAVLSLSSGAFLALLLQSFLIFWAFMLARNRHRWLLLLGLIALFYVAIDLMSTRTPIRVFMSYATFSSHTAYWRGIIFEWGMINVWANPWVGLGLNDWVRPSWMYSGSMDNFWLVMAVRYGIPGFLLLAVGYGLMLWRIGRRPLDGDPVLWSYRRAWMFSFVGLTFTLCTVHVWHTMYSFVFFMFGAGMWLLLADPQDASQPAADPTTPPRSRYSRFPVMERPRGLKPARQS